MAGGHGPQGKVTAILLLNKCDVPVKLTSKHLFFISTHCSAIVRLNSGERLPFAVGCEAWGLIISQALEGR